MNSESLGGGIIGTVTVMVLGGIGKVLLTYLRGRGERRKLTTAVGLSRDERAFETLERRITDLKEVLRDVAGERDHLQGVVDRIRAERDAAKESALDDRLRAKELDQRLRAAKAEHERQLTDCTEDLDDARETLARLNRREPECP